MRVYLTQPIYAGRVQCVIYGSGRGWVSRLGHVLPPLRQGEAHKLEYYLSLNVLLGGKIMKHCPIESDFIFHLYPSILPKHSNF